MDASSKFMGNPLQNRKKKSQFTEIFEEYLDNFPEWSEISEIARRNSYDMGRQSRIWIIGGFVYRPIIKTLHRDIREPPQIDVDLLIERGTASEEIYAPKGWEIKRTQSGFFYLEKGNVRIDPNYLYSFHSISSVATAMGSLPQFRHFFKATPMDIQSIAYDLTNKEVGVIGKRGIESIRNMIVRINYMEEAQFESQKRGLSLEDFVKEKAEELGFSYDLTPIYSAPVPKETNGKTSDNTGIIKDHEDQKTPINK
ncbi:MAG TPA: hypothetical protein VJ142_00600 [Candidatus Nanoarchaeia archaeon]|nr:hypothetical protein [Candidatus Nanoarchaeia archaeon]